MLFVVLLRCNIKIELRLLWQNRDHRDLTPTQGLCSAITTPKISQHIVLQQFYGQWCQTWVSVLTCQQNPL